MIETLLEIPVALETETLMKRVRVEPGTEDAMAFEQLVDRAREVAKPKAMYAESFVEDRQEDTVRIDGVTFTSRMLTTNLANVERVFPFVATCGHELDAASPPKGDFIQEFWWDTIKGVVLGCAVDHFNQHLHDRFLLGKTSNMKPGSGDAEVWPIQQQRELFSLFGDVREKIGVELTPSFLMIPIKSTSGIQFPTETDFRSCQVCRRENCAGRVAPFDQNLWDSIQHQ